MKNPYLKKFSYNREANNQFIEIFNREKDLPEQSLPIFSHILNAHLIWLNRMKRLTDTQIPDVWERQPSANFSALNQLCFEKSKLFLQNNQHEITAENIITYQNSKGKEYQDSVEEICFHILMHSMYHRGQIAKLFRKANVKPPVTDFIFYMRDQRIKS